MHELRSLVDFGLVILIWIVQLVVYPGFKYTAVESFSVWHSQYTTLISFLVVPLMFGQVGIVSAQLLQRPSWPVWLSMALVVVIWISTFAQAVPVHNALQAAGNMTPEELHHQASRLVSVNWVRTILWTCVFGLGLIRY